MVVDVGCEAMKLWLLEQDEHNGYDTYDSLVVAAESEDEARAIHPDPPGSRGWGTTEFFNWARKLRR